MVKEHNVGGMVRKFLIICFIFLAYALTIYASEEISPAEPIAAIVAYGLSSNFHEPYLDNKDETCFNPGIGTITFWAKINVLKPEEFIIQKTEWYSPDGKIWLEESQGVSNAVYSQNKNPVIKKGYVSSTIDMTQIPSDLEGVWGVRAYFNDKMAVEKYFTYGSGKSPPSENQIITAKKRIEESKESLALSGILSAEHFSSYLSFKADGYLEKQRIFRPGISFTPTDTIFYTLNADKKNIPQWAPVLRLFMISPDGEKYRKFNYIIYDSPVSGHIKRAQQQLDLKSILGTDYKKKGLRGLWKLDLFYVDKGYSIDQKYFYISEDKIDRITPEEIKALDNKIGEDVVFNKYLDFFEKNMAADGRKKNEVIVKQMGEATGRVNEVLKLSSIAKGTDKEHILKENGAPQTILRNKSGNELWIYWQENIGSKVSADMRSMHRSRMATHSSNVGAGIAGAFIGAAIDGLINIPTGEMTKVYFEGDNIEELVKYSNVPITDVK